MTGINDTDIDIDTSDRDRILSLVSHVNASLVTSDVIKKHNVGVYFQDAPVFLDSGNCSIDYKEMPKHGFFKIDILNNTVYDDIKNEEELNHILSLDVHWEMLTDRSMVEQLPHIHSHYDLLLRTKPKSVIELADVLALIRPAKKHLLAKYLKDKESTRTELYTKPLDSGFYFKYSHSIAYAVSITVVMNRLYYHI